MFTPQEKSDVPEGKEAGSYYSRGIAMHFKNQFGAVSLARISESKPVDSIFGRDLPDEYKFDIQTAEKLALITDNRGIQIALTKLNGTWRCYVVIHDSANMASFAKIEAMEYVGGIPSAEIQAARTDRGIHSMLNNF